MNSNSFSWLHLTDFHYGLKGQSFLWPTLRAPFLEDLERLHKLAGPWHAVLFTGDFVQSGDPAQFGEMQSEVLDRIWRKLNDLGSGDAVLLAVPGNHDLCRPDQNDDDAARDALLRKGQFDDVADKFWDNPSSAYRRVIDDAFKNYQNWWNGAKQRPKSDLSTGMLPGDFAYTLRHGERRIGIIGLNTTFLQLQDGDYQKHLVWNARQLRHVVGGAIDDWLSNHHVCLLLTHQGPDWLTLASAAHGETEIAPAGRFTAHLFGHMHETKIVYLSVGGGEAVRRCQGHSVFGMEKYGNPPSIMRAHGYSAGRIEFGEKNGTLRLWPRIATSKTGPWRFIPDHENATLPQDEATKPETISVRSVSSVGQNSVKSQARSSDFMRIPSSTWPEELAKKGMPMPDSMLLRPESRVVRFHRLREPLRDIIIDWAIILDSPIKLRLQAGEGGAGKTRLLIEVCHQLERSHGWHAGFIERSESVISGISELLKDRKPSLIVLDYAESRTNEIVEITKNVLRTSNAPPVRLVLLAREGGDWWDRLADASGNDQAVSAILRGHVTKTGPYRMAAERIEGADRGVIFAEALYDFAMSKGMQPPSVSQPDLSDNLFGNPLFIHLSALSHLRGQPSINDKELLGMALGHERSYWRQLLEADGLIELQPALEQAVALLTLCGPKRTAKDAKAILAKTPRLREVAPATLLKLFDVLRRLYPLEGGLVGLQPDVLGETLVSEELAKDDELLDAVFA